MKRIFYLLALFFCFTSCEEWFYSEYTAYNKSSYTVEFSIEGDYRTLAPGKSFSEKRYNCPDVKLLNDVPVKVSAGHSSVYFEDIIEKTYNLQIYNSLNEKVIIVIGKHELEVDSYSTSNVILNSKNISDIYIENKPAYKVNYTIAFENEIYYIRVY